MPISGVLRGVERLRRAGAFARTRASGAFPSPAASTIAAISRKRRAREAAKLARLGDDVHVSGIPAYSTLGYFDDPVLSTFVRYREVDLARLIFHELAHQVVYVKDDTAFNESFAVAVEEAGLRAGSRTRRACAARRSGERSRGARARPRACAPRSANMIATTRERLTALYASNASDEEKRAGKAEAFAA
jgi:predicted aminopeptidase